jgi:hypothetical protein
MKSETYQFTVENKGKTYQCERVVTGQRTLYQEIHVIGIGSKSDPAAYGKKYHPPQTMEGIARVIAQEIINGV